MLTTRTASNFELSPLPSTYLATETEVAFLCRLINSSSIINKAFRIDALIKITTTIGIDKTEQAAFLQGLARHGLIYSFSKTNAVASLDEINGNLDYFLNAEKTVQAIINRLPNQVIGTKLCKFEVDGNILDGGFVINEAEIFNTIMQKIDAYYGNREHQTSYLPSFIRLYECIGTADGRDFFNNINGLSDSLTSSMDNAEAKFIIPKYVVLNRQENGVSWVADNQRVCVCIS